MTIWQQLNKGGPGGGGFQLKTQLITLKYYPHYQMLKKLKNMLLKKKEKRESGKEFLVFKLV